MAGNGRRVLITGAGQGLGLEWARQELRDGATVFATARDPRGAADLQALGRAPHAGTLVVVPMDVSDDASVAAGAKEVAARTGALDDLVNNAGTYGPRGDRALAADAAEVRRVLEVNLLGPYRVTRAFLPLVKAGARPRVAFVTSRMGSIGDGPSGASYAYRMSKSALNMLGANLARDLAADGVVCLLLHPGWVRTRMGGERAPVEIAASVSGMRRVLERAGANESGTFQDYNGAGVPW